MSFQWQVRPTDAFPRLTAAYVAAIRRGVRAIADRYAPEITAWMIENAIWTDRTGNLRQTLHTEVEQLSADMVEIQLAYGMDYGIWVALMQAGRFDVIAPAIDLFAPRIWADVQAMLR